MADDTARQVIGTIGGAVSATLFWAGATLANDRLLSHLERRRHQRRGFELGDWWRDTRFLFYGLAVVCCVSFCSTTILQVMNAMRVEVESASSDLSNAAMVALYLSMISMVFYTVLEGVETVRRLSVRTQGIIHSSAAVTAGGGGAKRGGGGGGSSNVGIGQRQQQQQRIPSALVITSGNSKNASRSSNNNNNSSAAKQQQQPQSPLTRRRSDTEISLPTAGGGGTSNNNNKPPSTLSGGPDSAAVLRASRGSGAFDYDDEDIDTGNNRNDEQQHYGSNDDDGDNNANYTGHTESFGGDYGGGASDDGDDGDTSYRNDRFGATNVSTAGISQAGSNSNPPQMMMQSSDVGNTSGNNLNDDGASCCPENCWCDMNENRAILTMLFILFYYTCTTISEFIYESVNNGEHLAIGAWGSFAACLLMCILCLVQCYTTYVAFRDASAELARRFVSIFAILGAALGIRSIIVFPPLQRQIGAALLPATLYVCDSLSILILLIRVPKSKQ